MFCKHRFNLRGGREAAFLRSLQPSINSGKLRRRGMIEPALQRILNFARNFRKFILSFLRPGFRATHDVFQGFCGHGPNIANLIADASR